MAADRAHALDVLEDRCRREPGTVTGDLLARLRARPEAVARALTGTPLYARVIVAEPKRSEAWVVFTGNGHVGVLGEEAMTAGPTSPDLFLQGSIRSVLAAVLGIVEPDAALEAGVLVPVAPMDRSEPVLALVREELLGMADAYDES